MATLRFTILGCGSSGGVPRLGGDWGDCDPTNPKNRRRRCSMLIERISAEGRTRVLIDTSPDMREQLLDAGIGALDGVVFTHSHADHTHGIDDLRQIVFNTRKRLPVWADGSTQNALIARFGYAFVQPEGSPYPSILELHPIAHAPFHVPGPGGAITFTPFTADHGAMEAVGFRIGPLAYLPDAVALPEASWTLLQGLHVWVVDALRRKPHPTHAHLDMDYETLRAELPHGVEPAFDSMVISFDNQA